MARYDDADRDLEGWDEYRKLVLKSIEKLDNELSNVGDKIDKLSFALKGELFQLQLRVNTLEVRAGFMGALAGFVVTLVAQLVTILYKK